MKLPEAHTLPSFGELEGRKLFADLRAAWNDKGMTFVLQVVGKPQAPWCRLARKEDSDGLQLWIDTRDEHDIHRATRFCHHFYFLPEGGGPSHDQPVGVLAPIHRAKADPNEVVPGKLLVQSTIRASGYALQAHIPASALTGFDPHEHPRLGFSYAVVDRQLGWQTFSVGFELPLTEDPSLWGSLDLVRE